MRKFSEVLENYLNLRDEIRDPSYYLRVSIDTLSVEYGQLKELQEELDSYFKGQP